MRKMGRWLQALLATAVLVMGLLVPALAAEEALASVQVQILAINDFHGQLDEGRMVAGRPVGSAPVLAGYLKAREAGNPAGTLIVHAGDMVGASPPVSALLQDEPTIEFLNHLGFDVGTAGNHEFDEGVEELVRLVRGGRHEATGHFPGAAFPYTLANVVDAETGDPILAPYAIRPVNGVRLGFIGVVTSETPTIVVPSAVAGLEFVDEAEAVNRWVRELRAQGVEAIVLLAHLGGDQSAGGEIGGPVAQLARKVDDAVDIIVSGHTHRHINGRVDGKLIVQAYSNGTAFADVDLTVDPRTGDVLFSTASIVTTWADGITPDPEVQEILGLYEEQVAERVERTVAEAAAPITRKASPGGGSALGNLIADAQRWAMGADMAFMNPGGIRADLAAGPVTWGDLYTVQPFNNTLVKMDLTGEQVYQVLNQQWQPQADGTMITRFLLVSGLSYTWDDARPLGDKVLEIRDAGGNPMERSGRYSAVVNSFLAEGGDSFTVFTEGTHREVGPVDLDALVDYLKHLAGPIHATVEDRVERIGK